MRWTLLLLSLVLAAPAADAALCKKKSGQVLFRERCRKKEVVLDLAQVGAVGQVGAPGVKGDAGPAGAGQPALRVVDANGQRLPGFVNGTSQLIYPHGSRALAIFVGPTGFLPDADFLFEMPNCQGPRLMFEQRGLVVRAGVVGTSVFHPGDPVATRTTKSREFTTSALNCIFQGGDFDATTGVCCDDDQRTADSGPAVAVDLSSFTPPFTLELQQ